MCSLTWTCEAKVWLTTRRDDGSKVIIRLWEGVAVIGLEVKGVLVGDIVEGDIVGNTDGEDVGMQSEAQKVPDWSTGVSWCLQPEFMNTLDAESYGKVSYHPHRSWLNIVALLKASSISLTDEISQLLMSELKAFVFIKMPCIWKKRVADKFLHIW